MQNIEMTWRMVNMTVDQIAEYNEMSKSVALAKTGELGPSINETDAENFQASLWAIGFEKL